MKKCETHKLFWNKYFYKLVINNRLAGVFRNKNLRLAKSALDSLDIEYKAGRPLVLTKTLRQDVIKESHYRDAKKVHTYLNNADDYMLRVESSNLCIYSNDLQWITNIKSEIIEHNLEEFWEPSAESMTILNANTIIVEQAIPFEFRVTLGRKRGSENFAQWADKNPKQIKLGPVLREAMLENSYVDGMYFYARDDRTIQLCNLMLNNIRRVDRIVSKQNIDK